MTSPPSAPPSCNKNIIKMSEVAAERGAKGAANPVWQEGFNLEPQTRGAALHFVSSVIWK